jgi:hypothetical protein
VSLPDETNKAKPFIQKEISNEDQVKLIIQQATDEVHIARVSSNKDFVDSESEIDENDSMFEGYQDQLDGDECDLDALLIEVEKMIANAAAKDESIQSQNDGSIDQMLDGIMPTIRTAQALLLEARLCIELERDVDYCVAGGDNNIPSKHLKAKSSEAEDTVADVQNTDLTRRQKAADKIEKAICCLQDGLKKLTS